MLSKKNYIVFTFFSLILLAFALTSKPQVNGDGHEYSLIVKAFVNHYSPNITQSDISDRINDINTYDEKYYGTQYLENIKKGISESEVNAGNAGVFKSKNNSYYGYHFWFYPLLTAVTEKVLLIFNVNPLKSFQLVNALFLIFALYLIAIKGNKNAIASFLFLAGGVLFYLKWSHPEVMIYTLIFLSFYYLIKDKPLYSVAFISFASIQVVSLSLLFVLVPIYLACIKKENIFVVLLSLLKRWQVWLFGIISISSIIFYYIEFGKLSLIGSKWTSVSFINFDHFISYYFDLDQGLWLGAPWIFLFFIFFRKKIQSDIVKNLFFSLLFSVLICIPLLANITVNSGQSVFQRYALYSIAPIVAWCCVYSSDVLDRTYKKIIIILAAVLYTLFCRGFMSEINTLAHKPWTAYILEKYPQLYSPEPQIFIYRTFSREQRMDNKDSYAYTNKNGVVTKIIYRETDKRLFSDSCSGEYKDLNTHKPIDISTASVPRSGWRYITGNMYCDGFVPYTGTKYFEPIPNTIDFKKQGFPDIVAGVSGFSFVEPWGRWSEGSDVKLFLNSTMNKNVTFYMELSTFGPNTGKPLIMTVNNVSRTLVPEEGKENLYIAKFDFSESVKNPEITLKVPEPISPAKLKLNDDTREIGLGLIKMHWE
ncbi:hypothetical protein I7X01_02625 [Citrobacter sp. AN-PRR1]|jgi:hypothetical protein|uniref:DUF7024 domain-containing protein n=1 Tax=Citrobacter TaxID=544 RepID=UPI001B32475F|nr:MULTISPECIES: hypothetical protein [Citrobacter]MBP5851361.1 hypothetical protein [Citrobacter sp. AN-PRR1]MBY5200374.1 hypothetical protein [Citrobacter braakii]